LFRAKSSSNRIRSNQSTEIKYSNIRERGGGEEEKEEEETPWLISEELIL